MKRLLILVALGLFSNNSDVNLVALENTASASVSS